MLKKLILFFMFFVIFISIYGGMNYYVYLHLVNYFTITGNVRLLLQLVFWFAGSSYVLGKLIKKGRFIPWISYLGAAWMGCLSIAVFVLFINDVFAFVLPKYTQLIINTAMLTIPILVALSILNVLRGPVIKEVEVKASKNLVGELKIIHLSDIHLGMLTSTNWVKGIVEKVNNLEADIIVITGDMVDDEYKRVEEFIPIMRELKSKYGVYAVSGNHEIYAGLDNFNMFCKEANIEVLDNKGIILDGVNLIGVDDLYGRRNTTNPVKIEDILSDYDLNGYNILLSHQPVNFKRAVEKGIDLQLSGHTHKGQIPPLNFFVPIVYRYAYGLYQYRKSFIYTSSGTGTWGPPMRLFSSSEIVNLKLSN
ncbi:metallophosphoesterase [Alkaliphilus peptidifermentans]|uniref:Calcineurin-like phosphoesterase domain-containing protein n=1 Tax=Alkaliphilus peptidifermentans DSM 18978 TaxID=1120976 RepID=A0A1G5I8H9_9FIRM|nr:metallophosphoesterase [Alkaliphilus peptidifermentans]SCY72343.1 hypothetical protein SAMN03080606_02273 [Alkaliphilus peptidifermentans DSM 18978]